MNIQQQANMQFQDTLARQQKIARSLGLLRGDNDTFKAIQSILETEYDANGFTHQFVAQMIMDKINNVT